MTTYMEFNRDLFLCNTLQKDTDSKFSSLLFENTKGKSVITYNNLQNAMFYFIPKTANKIDKAPGSWMSLPATNTFQNVNDVLTKLKQTKDICNNTPPYTISSNLYFDLNNNAFTYDAFLNERKKYPTNTHIYAYTFGKLQVLDISSINQVNDIRYTTTITEKFQNYFNPVIEGATTGRIIKLNTSSAGTQNVKVIPAPIDDTTKKQVSANITTSVNNGINYGFNMITKNQLFNNYCKMSDTLSTCLSKLPQIVSQILSKKEGLDTTSYISTAVDNTVSNAMNGTQVYYSPKELKIYQISDTLYPVMDLNCANYPINSVCSVEDSTNCEICKNFAYRDWYDANNNNNIKSFVNHDDRKQEYFRTWVQTCNLGIGILLLSIGVYYQQSN